jgi:hypothetical protein
MMTVGRGWRRDARHFSRLGSASGAIFTELVPLVLAQTGRFAGNDESGARRACFASSRWPLKLGEPAGDELARSFARGLRSTP